MEAFSFVFGLILGGGLTVVVSILAAFFVFFRHSAQHGSPLALPEGSVPPADSLGNSVLTDLLAYFVTCITGADTRSLENGLDRPFTTSSSFGRLSLAAEGHEDVEAYVEHQRRMEDDPRVPEEVKAFCRGLTADYVARRVEEVAWVASDGNLDRSAHSVQILPGYLTRGTNGGVSSLVRRHLAPRKSASDLKLTQRFDKSTFHPMSPINSRNNSVTDTQSSFTSTVFDGDDAVISSYGELSKWYQDEAPETLGQDFSFDITKLQGFKHPLCLVAREVLSRLQLDRFLPPEGLNKFFVFVEKIAKMYNKCSYHNELHAADVTNRLCCILGSCGIARSSKLDAFSAIVAAIIHDVDHRGLSNNYQVMNDTELAVKWHGVAVLENHSLQIAYETLHHADCNFASTLSPADQTTFFKTVTAIVLATDMAVHFDLCELFQARVVQPKKQQQSASHDCPRKSVRGGEPTTLKEMFKNQQTIEDMSFYDGLSVANRLLALKMAMKCADLGHCCTPLGQHLQWCFRLEEELFCQGKKERDAGQSVSPLCDPEKEGLTAPHIQAGFFHGLVYPLISTYVVAFPSCQPLQAMASRNLKHWIDYSQEAK